MVYTSDSSGPQRASFCSEDPPSTCWQHSAELKGWCCDPKETLPQDNSKVKALHNTNQRAKWVQRRDQAAVILWGCVLMILLLCNEITKIIVDWALWLTKSSLGCFQRLHHCSPLLTCSSNPSDTSIVAAVFISLPPDHTALAGTLSKQRGKSFKSSHHSWQYSSFPFLNRGVETWRHYRFKTYSESQTVVVFACQ